MKKKILTVLGARPNFIKAAIISRELVKSDLEEIIVHTGQHYSLNLSEIFFEELQIPKPSQRLKIKSNDTVQRLAEMIAKISKIIDTNKPRTVMIYGDTDSTLAGAISAVKKNIPLIHIEGGERTYVKSMPEEINRVLCDHAADLNLCATKQAVLNLRKENLHNGVWVGDIMLDLFLKNKEYSVKPNMKVPNKYILLTIHRAENTDNKKRLKELIKSISKIKEKLIFPIHPRTKNALSEANIKLPKNIIATGPLPYRQNLWLIQNSHKIITDSGGLQKEAYWANIPCITLMAKTPWEQTLKGNWNQLINDSEEILNKLKKNPTGKPILKYFGDGKTASKILPNIIKFTV